MSNPGTQLATVKKQIVNEVEGRIQSLVQGEQLHLPPNYSAANALQAAGLVLQDVKTKDGEPALSACTRPSVANALFSMVVQGLDVGKKQGYFIAYGNTLTFQRSYFGTLAVAKRMAGVRHAFAEVIYKGDDFEYEIREGRKIVTKHTQSLDNVDEDNIRGAYAVVEFLEEGRPAATEIMTWPQIQKAWSKGQGNNPARRDFPGQMAMRTVLNRALKLYINSSDDNHLGLQEFNRDTDAALEDDAETDALENANRDEIDVDDDTTIDVEAAPVEDEPDAREATQEAAFEPEAVQAPF